MYLRPVLLMETFHYWRLFHYCFNLISEACCHAKFMSDTHISGFFLPVQIMNVHSVLIMETEHFIF